MTVLFAQRRVVTCVSLMGNFQLLPSTSPWLALSGATLACYETSTDNVALRRRNSYGAVTQQLLCRNSTSIPSTGKAGIPTNRES